MKSIHPKSRQAVALVAAISIVCACGCRNQTSGLPNPFLAPGRVPPPATRALLPGQAQPYYPGDPLPVMQSWLTPADLPSNMNNSPAPTQFTSNDGLSWGAPAAGGDAAGNQAPTDLAAIASNTSLPSIRRSNEPAISIPSDGDLLRFPLPVPEPIAATPVATAQLTAASPPTTAPTATAAPAQTVTPVAYLVPAPGQHATATPAQLDTLNARSNGPWRSPQLAAPSSGVIIGVPTVNPSLPNSMDVRLRAVPSPPPQPVDPTTPRIRLPGYAVPPGAGSASTFTQPAPMYVTQNPGSPVLQTVQIGPLPSPPGSMAANSAVPQGAVASGDGFRPRSSRR